MAGMGNDFVREARRRAGLTQRELAQRAGTTQSAIARIETGRSTPSYDAVLRLVRLCGYDLDTMLVERDDADWYQAQRTLRSSIDERATQLEHFVAQVRAAQAEAGVSMHRAV